MDDHVIECARCGKGNTPDYCGIIRNDVSALRYKILHACLDCGSNEVKMLPRDKYDFDTRP